ncbi:MAG: hypothetical protein JWO05_2856 [Gemmatimonadetes bacterium]|nr:hypothetical protein [Gemmatimonadota bacterium]
MTFLPLRQFAAVAILAMPLASARSYPSVSIRNMTSRAVTVVVSYRGCRSDKFSVPASTRSAGGAVVAGVATAPGRRGACLVSGVSATYANSQPVVTSFASQGTSYGAYTIEGTTTVRVWSDHERAELAKKP